MSNAKRTNPRGWNDTDTNEVHTMTDPLEHEIREALHREAESVPVQAIERVCSTDYKPRTANWQQAVRASLATLTRAVRPHR